MGRLTEVEWDAIKELFDKEEWALKSGLRIKFHKRVLEKFSYIDISLTGLYKKTSEWKKNFIQKNPKSVQKYEVNKNKCSKKKSEHKKGQLEKISSKGIQPELVKKIDKKNAIHWDKDKMYKLYLNKPIDMTDNAFCEKYGLSVTTLQNWKRDDPLLKETLEDYRRRAIELMLDQALDYLQEQLPIMFENDAKSEDARSKFLDEFHMEMKSIEEFRGKLKFANPEEVDKYLKIMQGAKLTEGTKTVEKIFKFIDMVNKSNNQVINITNNNVVEAEVIENKNGDFEDVFNKLKNKLEEEK